MIAATIRSGRERISDSQNRKTVQPALRSWRACRRRVMFASIFATQ
jgi:hypothetical protein